MAISITIRGRHLHAVVNVVDQLTPPRYCVPGFYVDPFTQLDRSMDRAQGGLRAREGSPDGEEQSWLVLGGSRGEGGILGEGIRQAHLRDPTYGPALSAASAMLGSA